jgi:hypothetical protein
MASMSAAELNMLLNQPGIFSYRAYGSSGARTNFLGCNGSRFDLGVDVSDYSFDDVGTVKKGVGNDKGVIKSSIGQILDLDNLVNLTGALFTRTAIAGTLVSAHDQVIASGYWGLDTPIQLEHQNGAGTCPTINSITGSVDGAMTTPADWVPVELATGIWGIVIMTGATEAQNITINTDYTPAASVDYTWGGKATITPLEVRFTTAKPDGKVVTIDFYKVFPNGKFGHGFGSENKPEPVLMDIELTAEKDTSRAEGDQVMKINIAS